MPEKGMSGLKQKSKHNHLIEHIQISVCTKLHTKQMILGLLPNLGFSWSKTGKVDITIKFSIFELV